MSEESNGLTREEMMELIEWGDKNLPAEEFAGLHVAIADDQGTKKTVAERGFEAVKTAAQEELGPKFVIVLVNHS